MRKSSKKIVALVFALTLSASAAFAAPVVSGEQGTGLGQVEKKVRKELVTLPWYGVFDNLAFEVDGSTVKLYGQVVQSSTRRDAERRVKRIAGIERVENNIEVLPLSFFDDSIRARTYSALLGYNSPLFRYGRGVNPSLHIVVNGGHLSLEGVVSTEGDSRLAYSLARGVSGVFSVTNNLRVENAKAR